MTVTPLQRRRIAWLIDGHLENDLDDPGYIERWNRQFAALSSPEEWFLYASESHPAQKPHEWRAVLDSPLCDQGTALLVFWRNSPLYHYRDGAADGPNRERYELVREIERRYAAGGYPSAVLRFDPGAFKGFSFLDGYAAAELERVPAGMRRPSPGEPVPPLAGEDFVWGDEF